jgi:hypothetical protein
MAAAAQPVRQTVRCPNGKCRLNQFVTVNGLCRRCTEPLFPKVVEPPKAKVVEIPMRSIPVGPVDMAGAIRICRWAIGLSQRQLADRMEVPRTYVSKLENYKAAPILRNIPRLASALEVTPYQLVMLATL